MIPYEFWVIFPISVKNVFGVLVGIVLNLQIALGNTDNLAIIIPLINEHKMSFHLFVPSSISFISVL